MEIDSYPLITVFVPWIGRKTYIQQAVLSLLRQDYPRLEVLISDNSLSATELSITATFTDPRIRIIRRFDRRLTAAAHYDACLNDAHGEFVMILSDDDLIEPHYVSSMYAAMASNPRVTVCLGEQIAISEHYNAAPKFTGDPIITTYDGTAFLISRLLSPRKLPIITYMSLFARRADLRRHMYRDYPDGSNSDNYMMMALAITGRVAVSSCKLYYRVYETSAGLSTPFESLLTACAEYEHDAVALLRRNQRNIGIIKALSLRTLLHVRNSSLMCRRLFHLYRKRLGILRFLASLALLALYACGISRSRPPRRS